MENLTDLQLITLYKEGNHKAFDGLINRYSQNLYRFVLKLLNNKEEARDAVQESFINAWKNIKKYDHRKEFKTWLFSIARNKSIDLLRKKKSVTFSSLNGEDAETPFEANIPDSELHPEELFERNETIELVQKALESIPFDYKTIVLLHDGEEMTFEEISEVVDKPMNTVKSQYRRALIALKNNIESQNAPKLQQST